MSLRANRRRWAGSVAAIAVVAVAGAPAAAAGGPSAADAQYTNVTPITKPKSPRTSTPKAETAGKSTHLVAAKGKGPLPFTGLSLLAPVAFSLVLVGGGVLLRRKFAARRTRP